MADGVWSGSLLVSKPFYSRRCLSLRVSVAPDKGPNLLRFLAPRETLVSSSLMKVISLIPWATQC